MAILEYSMFDIFRRGVLTDLVFGKVRSIDMTLAEFEILVAGTNDTASSGPARIKSEPSVRDR